MNADTPGDTRDGGSHRTSGADATRGSGERDTPGDTRDGGNERDTPAENATPEGWP